MKLSNLRNVRVSGPISNQTTIAEVDVTTGFWLWTKTRTETIGKKFLCWRFAGSGEYCPEFQAETLFAGWELAEAAKATP